VSPFNHYETWIKEDDYKQYLKLYSDGRRAIPSKEQVGEAEKKLAEKRRADRTKDVNKAKEKVAEVLNNEGFNQAAGAGGTRTPEYDGEGGIIAIEVSANKLARAEGKRKSFPDQVEIMGRSATEVSLLLEGHSELDWEG
jgi:hypothetical protein